MNIKQLIKNRVFQMILFVVILVFYVIINKIRDGSWDIFLISVIIIVVVMLIVKVIKERKREDG